jgi:DtxR family Mn-dependent transcriptional regulator
LGKTHGIDEYLEAIYVLNAEGETVVGSRLAEYLGVARPTVTQTMHKLTVSGLVENTDGREIRLTPRGKTKAEAIVRRHRLIERWLTDVLHLDWAQAHEEACRLEHAISPLVEERLAEHLGNPTTCPHGNVIPGLGIKQSKGIPLSEVNAPATVTVVRIVEQAEEDPELLRFLQSHGLVPDARIQVEPPQHEYEAGIRVRSGGDTVTLSPHIADRILVHMEASNGVS